MEVDSPVTVTTSPAAFTAKWMLGISVWSAICTTMLRGNSTKPGFSNLTSYVAAGRLEKEKKPCESLVAVFCVWFEVSVNVTEAPLMTAPVVSSTVPVKVAWPTRALAGTVPQARNANTIATRGRRKITNLVFFNLRSPFCISSFTPGFAIGEVSGVQTDACVRLGRHESYA